MVSFGIDFHREYKIYLSGEVLEGDVVISCQKVVEISELTIRLVGETKTGWSDSKSKLQLKSHEVHLQVDQNLAAELQNLQKDRIYKIAFKYDLPKQLPSSVKCDLGWTRYACVLIVDKKEVADVEFTIIAHVPLEYNPSLEKPVIKSKECVQKGGVSGSRDTVIVNLRLPKEEYLVGETINASIVIEIIGSRIFNCFGVGLVQDLAIKSKDKLHSKIQRATVSRLLVETTFGPVAHPALARFDGFLRIPTSAPPSQIGGLISVRYSVVVVGDHESFPDIAVPILIGHTNEI